MDRSKLLTIAVIGLLVINLGTLTFIFSTGPAFAREEGHGPPHGEGPKKIIIERLGFDAQQQKDYDVIVEEHRSKSRELMQESRELHNDLFSLLRDSTVNKIKADSLIEQIALNQKTIDHLNVDHFQKIKALCKGEQLTKFNELVSDLGHLFAPKGPGH